MNTTILDVAIITSIIIGFFLSISLVTAPFYKSRANKYLSLSLFLIASLTFLDWSDIENFVLQFLNNISLELLVAVTLFTFFLIQIQPKYLKKGWYKWLYLPFFSALIIEIFITFSDYVLNIYSSDFDAWTYYIKMVVSIGYNLFLIFLGRKLIKSSNTISEDKRRWLLRLNFFMICIIMCWVLSYAELYTYNSEYTTNILWILLSFLLWWVLYYGVFKLQIITQKEEIHQYLISQKKHSTQAKKKLKRTNTSKIITQLYELMEDEELYKNPLISRLDLATRLSTNEGYLSQIINEEINKSVIQFVNGYRIDAAKKLLLDPVFNKYSLEAIGLEVGFKSRSTFYNVFKISLGMSPGAYRKHQKMS